MFTNYQYTQSRLISHWFCTSNHFFKKWTYILSTTNKCA